MVPEDNTFWEAEDQHGNVMREQDGHKYSDIDRDTLKLFRLVHEGNTIFETWPPTESSGHGLVYRRRTAITGDQRNVTLIVGWVPRGPAYAINVADSTYRKLDQGFDQADPELYPPILMTGERF